ncbi:uncharacterized protein LOC116346242 [Contarinia nasturtii]|uniref:uncharacterized protein LOC116346242 n=1 Tax=Contarinia nasturtii TaxID=265458 RepID=UPI0012D377A9|nr:uncharacterized protein LOC116346242 [Contarinia nasturtii]
MKSIIVLSILSLLILTQVINGENIHEFLEKCLKKRVLEYTLRPLTKPGDNFKATIQSLEVKLLKSNDSNEIETRQLVYKMPLTGVNNAQKIKIFVYEINFYTEIIPAIERFAATLPTAERNDIFVRFLGSRLSSDSNAKNIDSNAAILLENIKSLGYVGSKSSIESTLWNNFETDEIMAILKSLAYFHALGIGIRRLQPSVFYSKVDPYLHRFCETCNIEKDIKRVDKLVNQLRSTFPKMTRGMQNTIRNQLNDAKNFYLKTERSQDTPYTTISHNDLWSMNIMFKRDKTAKKSIQVKLLDFQMCGYESFALDLMFLLLFNAPIEDLRMNFKSFIEYYHSEFVKTLRLVNCSHDDYTFEKMWNEIKGKAKISLFKLYLFLGRDKINTLQMNSTVANPNPDFYLEQPTPQNIINRWQCINDVYIANGLLWK